MPPYSKPRIMRSLLWNWSKTRSPSIAVALDMAGAAAQQADDVQFLGQRMIVGAAGRELDELRIAAEARQLRWCTFAKMPACGFFMSSIVL